MKDFLPTSSLSTWGGGTQVRVPVAPMTWSEGQDMKQGFPFFATHSVNIGWKRLLLRAQTTRPRLSWRHPCPGLYWTSHQVPHREARGKDSQAWRTAAQDSHPPLPHSALFPVSTCICTCMQFPSLISSSPHISRSEDHKQKG